MGETHRAGRRWVSLPLNPSYGLPDDPELRADLTAPTYDVTDRGIRIEGKDDIRARLGRLPGKGDAVVMCLSEGHAAVMKAMP